MRLDAALLSADLEWLTTRAEKLAWLQARTASESPKRRGEVAVPPAAAVDQCPGTFPIGIDARGRVLLLYLATVPWTDDFRTFLIGHTDLLAVSTHWTVRVVFPPALRRAVAAYQTVIQEELQQPLSAAHLSELRHHFFHRRRGTDLRSVPEPLRTTLRRYAKAFSGPRFTNLYRRWLAADDAVLKPGPTSSREALASGRGQVEDVVLPHSYDHLVPLVNQRRLTGSTGDRQRRDRRKEEQRGAQPAHSVNPLLNPVP
jgi:hypothetical protein